MSGAGPSSAQITAEWIITDPLGDLARWLEGIRRYEAGSVDDSAAMGEAAELMCAALAHYLADGTVIGRIGDGPPEAAVAQTIWNVLVATLHGGGGAPLGAGSARCLRLALAAARRGGYQAGDLGGNGLMDEMFDEDSRAVMTAALSGLPSCAGEAPVELAPWFAGPVVSKPVLAMPGAPGSGRTPPGEARGAAGSRWAALRQRAQQAGQHVNPLVLQYGIEAVQGALTGAQVAKVDRAGNLKIRKFGVAKAALQPSKTLRRALDGAALTERLKAYNQQLYGTGASSPAADAAPSAWAAIAGAPGPADGQPRVPPLGSGRRLRTSQDPAQCIQLLESLLRTYRTPKYQHMPSYVFPRWTWNGAPAAPTTAVACHDQAGDFMLITFWPAGTGSEAGVFPLGSGDKRLKSLPLIKDWAARDTTLRPAGTFEPGLISLASPYVTPSFVEDLLTTAGFPRTPDNMTRAARRLATMLLIKAEELIASQDPGAARRFSQDHSAEMFFRGGPASSLEDYLNWILAALGSWNYAILPYIQDLPAACRAIMLDSVAAVSSWDESGQ